MIFLDKTAEELTERYPSLEVVTEECFNCGREMVADKSFVTNGWVGLRSSDCDCGEAPALSISTPVAKDIVEIMNSLILPLPE